MEHSYWVWCCFQLFNIYIKKAAEIYGVPKTRQIYEKAVEVLAEENAREMCLRFAEMETKLGEIDRARAIYAHCSQMCDPRVCNLYSVLSVHLWWWKGEDDCWVPEVCFSVELVYEITNVHWGEILLPFSNQYNINCSYILVINAK